MITFPSGPVTPLGHSLLISGIDPNLWLTSPDGARKFYLMGGMAPVAPGLPGQDGIIVQSVEFAAPFKHKDLQAASQDGVTWTQTVYEPGIVALQGEAHAATAAGLSAVWDAWQGTWSPRKNCTLEYITPDGGYWWAPVRLAKAWQGAVQYDRRFLYRKFQHECRIDDAFWRGAPSTDTFIPTPSVSVGEAFVGETGALSSSWTVTYSSGHTGTVQTAAGVGAYWSDSGNTTQSAEVISYNTSTSSISKSSTDYQLLTMQLGGSWAGINTGGSAFNDFYCRVDTSGNAIVCRIGFYGVWVYRVNSGAFTQIFYQPLASPPRPNETWTFYCGTQNGPRTYALRRGNTFLWGFGEPGAYSVVSSAARGFGFGMVTQGGSPSMASPIPVAYFTAADNTAAGSSTGTVQLFNVGTEDGWPTYTLTGPATRFQIGDGPGGVGGAVSIGPIAAGQAVQVTTFPQNRSVIDVANPSNNLYPLMSGRFTTPIPGVAMPADATSVIIPVAVAGGDATTSIVANLTPLRIAPV